MATNYSIKLDVTYFHNCVYTNQVIKVDRAEIQTYLLIAKRLFNPYGMGGETSLQMDSLTFNHADTNAGSTYNAVTIFWLLPNGLRQELNIFVNIETTQQKFILSHTHFA